MAINRNVHFRVVLFITICAFHSECAKVTLELINWLSFENPAFICCSEKDQVLGDLVRVEWPSSFLYECRTTIIGTSCKCEVRWLDHIRHFKAYTYFKDSNICGTVCKWYLIPGGPQLADKSSTRDRTVFKRSEPWIEQQ